jgi:hypothetical protein
MTLCTTSHSHIRQVFARLAARGMGDVGGKDGGGSACLALDMLGVGGLYPKGAQIIDGYGLPDTSRVVIFFPPCYLMSQYTSSLLS